MYIVTGTWLLLCSHLLSPRRDTLLQCSSYKLLRINCIYDTFTSFDKTRNGNACFTKGKNEIASLRHTITWFLQTNHADWWQESHIVLYDKTSQRIKISFDQVNVLLCGVWSAFMDNFKSVPSIWRQRDLTSIWHQKIPDIIKKPVVYIVI